MEKIINPNIQWEYTTINIAKDVDIAERLNKFGKDGWECFHIDVTVFGSTAYMKRINYSAMERKRLEVIAKSTNRTIEEVIKSEYLNKLII